MEGVLTGVGIGLSIMGLLVGILLLFLLDLGIAATAERLGLLRRSKPISLFPDRVDGPLPGSGPEVPENKQLQRTRRAQATEPRR